MNVCPFTLVKRHYRGKISSIPEPTIAQDHAAKSIKVLSIRQVLASLLVGVEHCVGRVLSRHRKTESRFVISAQGSMAVVLRKRKKRGIIPFFQGARSTSHAPCLLAAARNRAASSNVGLAALPPLTWIRIICKASPLSRHQTVRYDLCGLPAYRLRQPTHHPTFHRT